MKTRPKVSILISNYNYAHYLPQALDSVFAQTVKDFELVLVDDASTDNSLKIINQYLEKYPNIKFFSAKKNMGFFKAYQKCFDLASGKYLVGMSADDKLLPEFLEANLYVLEKHNDVMLSFSRFATFKDSSPTNLSITDLQMTYPNMKLTPDEFIKWVKMKRLWIPGNTIVVRKSLLEQLGYFDPKFSSKADWFLFHSIAFSYPTYFLAKTLAAQRLHCSAMSHVENKNKIKQSWINMIEYLKHPENKKLKKAFIRSHIFNTQGFSFFDMILKNPRHWLFFKQYTYKHFYKRWKSERKKSTST